MRERFKEAEVLGIDAVRGAFPQHISDAEKIRLVGQIGISEQQRLDGFNKRERLDHFAQALLGHIQLHL